MRDGMPSCVLLSLPGVERATRVSIGPVTSYLRICVISAYQLPRGS
jgi:hypothetical protein